MRHRPLGAQPSIITIFYTLIRDVRIGWRNPSAVSSHPRQPGVGRTPPQVEGGRLSGGAESQSFRETCCDEYNMSAMVEACTT
ncbi:Hypothetical protein NTJ_16138 [Nesidiocoris tenuis]|uniref:Uncharacterized protein n=1 Tax=Nesidiocoris tenuis TaxID=355587 RepID=A0ABN7BII0_9HEMI|nr:Hypothetical protein NTJ_16138 [Nesidiocoris tenuis]